MLSQTSPGTVVLDEPGNIKTTILKRLHDRVRYSSMRPHQIDAKKKKMCEYSMARRVATTDEIMSDTQDEQMLVNMTSVTPQSLTTSKFLDGDRERMHHEQEREANAKIKIGIYSCVLTRFLSSIDMPLFI